MGTLKTTIKVESTNLFPTPVSFTKVNDNPCTGDTSGFNYLVVGTVSQQLNITPIAAAVSATNAGGAYVYLKAKSTNTAQIYIDNVAAVTTATPICLGPDDTCFIRVGKTGGTTDLYAISTAAGQGLEYFIGEKA